MIGLANNGNFNELIFQVSRPSNENFNLRDLGGLATNEGRNTKYKRIYRSSSLDGITESDFEIVNKLNIKTAIDLRSRSESLKKPSQLTEIVPKTFSYPLISSKQEITFSYIDLITSGKFLTITADHIVEDYYKLVKNSLEQLNSIFRYLADEKHYPVIFFCYAGKDRTGVLVALLLALLDVNEQCIADDYSISSLEWRDPNLNQYKKIISDLDIDYNDVKLAFEVNPGVIINFLNRLTIENGSIRDFAMNYLDLDSNLIKKLKQNLLS